MAAIQLKEGEEFDGKALAKAAYEHLPGYAAVRPRRRVARAHSTPASGKVDLRGEATAVEIEDPIYVLAGRDEGYVEFYDEYPDEVKDGKRPKSADWRA